MHELTIARNLIEMVAAHAASQGETHVAAIRIRLGELSGFRRALLFCFDRAARGTVCDGAALEIEEVPLTVQCRTCNAARRPTARYTFRCGTCGMPANEVVTGREMQVTGIEFGAPASPARPIQPAFEEHRP